MSSTSDLVLKLIKNLSLNDKNSNKSEYITKNYELFLKALSCPFSNDNALELDFILLKLRWHMTAVNSTNLNRFFQLIDKLKNALPKPSLTVILTLFYGMISSKNVQIDYPSHSVSSFSHFSHLQSDSTITPSYRRSRRDFDDHDTPNISINRPQLNNDSSQKYINPIPKLQPQQEIKGFISKEVIDKLGTDPHSTSWLLINSNLPDGQKCHDIVSELIHVMQGLDGKDIEYDSSSGQFGINAKLNLPVPVMNLVYKIAELGYLYRQINKFCNPDKSQIQSEGLVKHAFTLALKSHLDDYIGLMASIDSDLLRDLNEKGTTTIGLTHLHAITLDFLWKFMYLYNATRTCENHFGGDLLSIIYKFSVTGDPMLQRVGRSLLIESAKPINQMLVEWLNEGHLIDSYNEFFIYCDSETKIDKLWSGKYNIRYDMIPTFISINLAKKILDIGKSINFVKIICQSEYASSKYNKILHFENIECEDTSDSITNSLTNIVDSLHLHVSKYVLKLLFDKYNLTLHLDALYRYLLLAQGDFIRHLMELLKPFLSTHADNLHLNNMTSILESAINSTNAQYDSKEVLQRLDCKLAAISRGDLGWDVFTLYYHTRGPLQVIVDTRSMDKYLKIFHFLWFIKRTVYLMDELSKDEIVCDREYRKCIQEGRDLFYQLSICKHEMLHFINQLEYFITFEVLECSRAKLLLELKNASGLDDIISAHEEFLNDVLSLCFISEQSELIMPKLHDAFKKVIHFESHFRSIMSIFGGEKLRRRTSNTKDPEFVKTLNFWKEKLKHLCDTFRKLMLEFMQSLMESSNPQHYYLAFRLDFNEFYLKRLSEETRRKLKRNSTIPIPRNPQPKV